MNKFIVIVFPEERQAYEGIRALQDLHWEGSLTLYSDAVIQRTANGKMVIKQTQDDGPIGTGLGALTGGLVGLFGGPVGAAVGVTAGMGLGAVHDLYNLGVSDDFLDAVGKRLAPGMTAVVAEVSEEWLIPLDTRMEALGGIVIREWRDDFIDDQIEKRVEKLKRELAQRKAELASARDEKAEAMKKEVKKAEAALHAAEEKAKLRLTRYHDEAEAKIRALQEQAKKARADAKASIDARIAEIRDDQKQRLGKLEQARKLTLEALRP